MNSNFLINILSKFDLNKSYLNLWFEMKMNTKCGKYYYIYTTNELINVFYAIICLNTISDKDINSLAKWGSFGYYSGGIESRFVMDLSFISIALLITFILIHNRFD